MSVGMRIYWKYFYVVYLNINIIMSKTYYKIKSRRDGFGSQYHAMMSAIAFCEYKNYEYIHSPFPIIQHNVDSNMMNVFIGIPIKIEDKIKIDENVIIEEYCSNEIHLSKNPSIYYTDSVITKIRNYYYSTEKPEIHDIEIAIHIRRGDVNQNSICRSIPRFISNDKYIKIIQSLKEKYPNFKISIFSEGKLSDFEILHSDNVYFHLNEDIRETFHSLVSSKILVMANSSFSYSSALLNKNMIYYSDFWHDPLNHWLNINTLL